MRTFLSLFLLIALFVFLYEESSGSGQKRNAQHTPASPPVERKQSKPWILKTGITVYSVAPYNEVYNDPKNSDRCLRWSDVSKSS